MDRTCTACGTTMRPLFTSYFCPRDCDRGLRGGEQLAITVGKHSYRMMRLQGSDPIPAEATYGWWLYPEAWHLEIEREGTSDRILADLLTEHWAHAEHPGWEISPTRRMSTTARNFVLLVFIKIE